MNNKLLPLASAAVCAGLAIARDTREIATAWSRYRQDVFTAMLEARAKLLRDTAQSFHDGIAKIAETASRMARRPHDAPQEASVEG